MTMMFPYFCFVVDISLSQELRHQQPKYADVVASPIPFYNNSYNTLAYGRGMYSMYCATDLVSGVLLKQKTRAGRYDGCHPFIEGSPNKEPWVPIVERGGCKFAVKIDNAIKANASAIIVYDSDARKELTLMEAHCEFFFF